MNELRRNVEALRRLVRAGRLPVLRLGSNRAGYRVRPADLNDCIREGYGPAGPDDK